MPESSAPGPQVPDPLGPSPAPGGAGAAGSRSAVRALPWWAYTVSAVVVVMLTGLAIWWLLGEAGDDPKLRIEAIRTALTVGLGAGGAFALLINARRQWLQEQAHLHAERTDAFNQAHQERVADAAERDAAERRVTELYNAAATQLGSDQAPVRLTALYTLERLADTNPDHQQTIVNIICAYLRMPYTEPTDPDPADQQRRAARRYHAARLSTDTAPATTTRDPYEERQVRLTAQRILHTHLQPDATPHWADINLDLTGATLLNFTLTDCHLNTANFTKAKFSGIARFIHTKINGDASFGRARFDSHAWFIEASISGAAWFTEAKIGGHVGFVRARIMGHAWFSMATINGNARFDQATIGGGATFIEAKVGGTARFDQATIGGTARFDQATIGGGATFTEAKVGGAVILRSMEVGGALRLRALEVADRSAAHELPPGWRIEPEEGSAGRVVAEAPPPA